MDDLKQLWSKTPTKLAALAGVAAAGVTIDQRIALSNDLQQLAVMSSVLRTGRRIMQTKTLVPDVFAEAARKWPQKPCLAFEDRSLTFQEVEEASNRVAHWALRHGLLPGDKVALLMENRPEFIISWLGLQKVGAVAALINTHLLEDGLLHCIKIAEPKLVLVGVELLDKFASVVPDLLGLGFHVYGDGVSHWPASPQYPFAQSLDDQLLKMDAHLATRALRVKAGITPLDTAMLIYTSGTTGLPKAARVNHYLVLVRALGLKVYMAIGVHDSVYCPLPLYHTSGGNLAVGICFYSGATLCIGKRFSTTRFWADVRKFDCTIVQYIGEMCRYLVNAPARPDDKENRVRAAFGNGLRPDVWNEFQDRFDIPVVHEFYGSTEGIMGFANYCTTPEARGHLGKRGLFMKRLLGAKIVRYDVEKDDYVRGKSGFLEECDYDEVGELICKIVPNDPARKFGGYYGNAKESNKKVLRDVFTKGDAYFRTGDLFKIDSQHCWHFIDRVGDTFRWKGENVATNEVAQAVSKFDGLSDICVYGVEVPGNEGRACMAAMVFDERGFDMQAFAQHVKARLPSYAVPLFLRQLGEMSVTGTMKYEKAKLRKQGMDPTQVPDKLWFYNKDSATYEPLTPENFHSAFAASRL